MLQGRERPCPRAAGKAADRWCARDGGNGEQASRAASAPSRAGPVGKEDSQRRFFGRDAGRLGTPRQAGRRARRGQKQGAPAGPDDARKGRDEGSDKGISSACPGTGLKKASMIFSGRVRWSAALKLRTMSLIRFSTASAAPSRGSLFITPPSVARRRLTLPAWKGQTGN